MSIGLTMIVKDEEKVIGRCLDSVLSTGLISVMSIVDTGSTDKTKKIVAQKANEYSVELILQNKPFTDFSECRNLSLDALRGKTEYGMWIDADEQLVIDGIKPNKVKSLVESTEMLYVYLEQGEWGYPQNKFFKIKDTVSWNGMVHEYLWDKEEHGFQMADRKQVYVATPSDGASWQDKDKLKKYTQLLEVQCKIEPNEPRWVYYLAHTLMCMNTPETDLRAKWIFMDRVNKMKGNLEELYVSKVMLTHLIHKIHGYIDQNQLISCHTIYKRIEHINLLAKFYMETGVADMAYNILIDAEKRYGCKIPIATYPLNPREYYFGVYFLLVEACNMLGKTDEMKKFANVCMQNIKFANQKEIDFLNLITA
jgi:glycosyltransferase involved in cell wall biosynthesis